MNLAVAEGRATPPNAFAPLGKSAIFSYNSVNSAIFLYQTVNPAIVLYQEAAFSILLSVCGWKL